MSGSTPSTWDREVAVLRAIINIQEANPSEPAVWAEGIEQVVSLNPDQIQLALRALRDGGLILGARNQADGAIYTLEGVSGTGRQKAGVWPDPNTMGARLVEALEQIASDTSRPEPERTKARAIMSAIGSGTADVARSVVTAALLHVTGMG